MSVPEHLETTALLRVEDNQEFRIRDEFESVRFECRCGWIATADGGSTVPFPVLSSGILLGRCRSCFDVYHVESPDLDPRWWVEARFGEREPEPNPTASFTEPVAYDAMLDSEGETAALAICSEGHLTCVGSHAGTVIRRKSGEYGPFRTFDSTISLDEELVVSGREPGYVRCTGCDEARQITCDGIETNDEGHHILSLHSGETTPYRVTGQASGERMCPTCGNYGLSEYIDRQEGPDNPELGWEYYECDVCGDTHRPEALLDVEHPYQEQLEDASPDRR